MMYINRPNHLGIFVGKVISYNPNKGYVKFKTIKPIDMGDCIVIGDSSCKISELMIDNKNFETQSKGKIVTTGALNMEDYFKYYLPGLTSQNLSYHYLFEAFKEDQIETIQTEETLEEPSTTLNENIETEIVEEEPETPPVQKPEEDPWQDTEGEPEEQEPTQPSTPSGDDTVDTTNLQT